MKKNLAYKYRIYPNTEQQVLFAKAFGCMSCESSINRRTRGDSSFMLDAMASSSEKPPLQMRSIKWWEYVTFDNASADVRMGLWATENPAQ